MKKIFLLLFTCAIANYLFAQEGSKELDFIIVIDEQIPTGSIAKLQVRLQGKKEDAILYASYYPGSLNLSVEDYSKVIADSTAIPYLEFTYYDHSGNTSTTYRYAIELQKVWLTSTFNILHIYNLDKKKYKNLFINTRNLKYVIELDSPAHTFKQIRKR